MSPGRLSIRDALSIVGALALSAAPFLPWLRIGDVALVGLPDPAAYFVLALGIVATIVAVVSIVRRQRTPKLLVLVGVAGISTLAVVWRTGPVTIADRAQARAEAVALVDNTPVQPVPPVEVGTGLLLGMAASVVLAAAGLNVRRGGS